MLFRHERDGPTFSLPEISRSWSKRHPMTSGATCRLVRAGAVIALALWTTFARVDPAGAAGAEPLPYCTIDQRPPYPGGDEIDVPCANNTGDDATGGPRHLLWHFNVTGGGIFT